MHRLIGLNACVALSIADDKYGHFFASYSRKSWGSVLYKIYQSLDVMSYDLCIPSPCRTFNLFLYFEHSFVLR